MCFSLGWFEQLLILLVIVCAVVAILKVVVPWVVSKLGQPAAEGVGIVARVFDIVVWALIAIFVIYVCFALISCLMNYSGGLPLLPHR